MATIERVPRIETPSNRFVLHGVSWQQYEALRALDENYHVRMAYDQGALEMMSPSEGHEETKRLIRRMIEKLTEELEIPLRSRGATTWKNPELERALEADECYYIKNFPAVAGRRTVDLKTDPPPDLAVEAEYSRSIVDKLPIYASLGIPEIWRSDGAAIIALHLGADGRYQTQEFSWNLPFLRVAELNRFLLQFDGTDETAWIRSFRAWVRETFGEQEPSHGHD
ncbi:MAG TPA: Uma2 family endonuclease [Pirellulales bacterium]|nr:Uma2 family endonuclease [Pirellulales bacterium]